MDAAPARNLIAFNGHDVEDFERLVYARQHEAAGQHLVVLLSKLQRVYDAPGYPATPEAELYLYTRLAAALTALFVDETFALLPAGFTAVALHRSVIPGILEASSFEGSDHLLRLVGARDAQHPAIINFPTVQQQLKLLLAYSLDSGIDLDFEAIFRRDPALLLPAFLGLVGRYEVLTQNAQRRHAQLTRLGPLFEQVEVRIEHLPTLAAVWMNSMYGTEPDRHKIKCSLNVLARRALGPMAEIERAAAARRRRPLAERPVMLLPLEHFRVPHVNYRTFAPLVRRLRERFTLVGAGTTADFDDTSAALFDRMVEFAQPGEQGLAPVLAALQAVEPDVVYYNSLGIQWWWVALGNARLAPIQLMTMGVPATSHSAAIDYVVVEESWAGEPDCYSETLVHARAGATRFEPRRDAVPRDATPAPAGDGTTRIAVSALVTKLNPMFLAACADIAQRSRIPLQWHFFAGMSGLHHVIAARGIQAWIPGAWVHPYMEFPAFCRALARCDLQLNTFPFGGINTILDSMQIGIPMVSLRGRESHSQSDSGMMRRAGLPEWLVSSTVEGYVETALRLIHGPKERAKIRRQLLETPLEEAFGARPAGTRDDFADAFCWIYQNHEAIRASGRKCWTVADRGPAADGKSAPKAGAKSRRR